MRGTLGSLLLEKKEKDQLASSEKAQRIEAGLFEVFVFLIILCIYLSIFGYSGSSLLRAGFFF